MKSTAEPLSDDFRPRLPEVEMHLHTPNDPAIAVVVSNERCTAPKSASMTHHVELDVAATQLAGRILPGQAFGILAPGLDERGRPHKLRQYSISSPTFGEQGNGEVISTTVKRLIREHEDHPGLFLGVTSNYLCDLSPGDQVRLTGPHGKRFLIPLNAGDHDYVMFATGTGIGPFRGMITDLLRVGVESRITLIMGSPYRTDLLYDEHFRSLADQHPNFLYLPTLSRESHADGSGPKYVHQRISSLVGDLAQSFRERRALIYICGVAGMELGVFAELARHLDPVDLPAYLGITPEAMADIPGWERRMIHRAIKPRRRIFMEVY